MVQKRCIVRYERNGVTAHSCFFAFRQKNGDDDWNVPIIITTTKVGIDEWILHKCLAMWKQNIFQRRLLLCFLYPCQWNIMNVLAHLRYFVYPWPLFAAWFSLSALATKTSSLLKEHFLLSANLTIVYASIFICCRFLRWRNLLTIRTSSFEIY